MTLQSALNLTGKDLREEMEESHRSTCGLLGRQMPSLWRAAALPKQARVQVERAALRTCHVPEVLYVMREANVSEQR